ncbi:MAG: hypothetical protein VB092_00750, partial [Oscillospiraceae bacterium]|nr:hypothetical protein [Oscillospiraceae bacterium]
MKLKPKRRLRPLLAALTLILVAALAAGVTAYVKTRGEKAVLVGEQTQQAKAEVEALVSLSCAGTQIPCAAAEFSVLDLDDRMTTVTLRNSAPTPSVELSRFGDALVFARAPKSAEVVVTHGGAEVFRGTPEQFNASFRPAEDGVYDFAVTASMENISASGSASYAFSVTYKIVPVFALSRDSVPQGGALVVSGENLRASDALAVRVSFSYTPHIVRTETGFYCYIPFNYLRAPGEYTLEVECNGQTTQLPYTVTAVDYEEQHLVVDETTESTTIGDAEALAVYNSTIAGLDEIADDADYTTGLFQWPCEGEITTAFGAQRYINDAAQPSSIHA